jgi:16S rRNA G966 N2-methylase RsmD
MAARGDWLVRVFATPGNGSARPTVDKAMAAVFRHMTAVTGTQFV